MPRFPGGIIRKTPITPAGPYEDGAATGMWTLAGKARLFPSTEIGNL